MLRIENEIVGNLLNIIKVNLDLGHGVIANIMIAHCENDRHYSVKFFIQPLKKVIQRIPAVEASSKPVIIGIVSSQYYDMRVILH